MAENQDYSQLTVEQIEAKIEKLDKEKQTQFEIYKLMQHPADREVIYKIMTDIAIELGKLHAALSKLQNQSE